MIRRFSQKFNIFTLGIFLFICAFKSSGLAAKISDADLKLLEEYKANFNHTKNIVNQCDGTCYMVSSLDHLEDLVSSKLGQDVSISHVDYIESMLGNRLANFFTLFFTEANVNHSIHKGLDIFSEGTLMEVINHIVKNGVTVTSRKNTFEIYQERNSVQQLFGAINKSAISLINSMRIEIESESKEILFDILKTLETYKLQGEFESIYDLDFVKEMIEDLYQLLKDQSESAQYRYYRRLLSIESKIERMSKVIDRNYGDGIALEFKQLFYPYFSQYKSIEERYIAKVIESVSSVFAEVRSVPYYHNLEQFRLNISRSGKYEKLYREFLIDEFHEFNNYAPTSVLSYVILKNTFDKSPQLQGLQFMPNKATAVGVHQVVVVDTIKNENGEVVYLVIRNSWGKGHGYKGYDFYHRSLFGRYIGMRSVDFAGYEIKLSKIKKNPSNNSSKQDLCRAYTEEILSI